MFWKTIIGIILATIISIQLEKQEKDLAIVLKLAACAMSAIAVFAYLQPIFDFFTVLEQEGDLMGDYLQILLRAMGVAFTAETAALVCTDAGSSSLGKMMNLMGTVVILHMSLPILQGLFNLILEIAREA